MSASTASSYIDSAKGYVQSGISSITGSTGDAQKAQERKDKAEIENQASHTVAKVGPYNITPSGISQDSPERTQGQWDQTIGSAKETIGNFVGNESLKNSGQQQNLDGQAREAKGELNDLASSTANRVTGAVGGAAAALTGDREKEAELNKKHDEAKATLRGLQAQAQERVEAQH